MGRTYWGQESARTHSPIENSGPKELYSQAKGKLEAKQTELSVSADTQSVQ